MNNYNDMARKSLNFLDRVSTTGINEANDLVGCVLFLDKVANGELIIVEPPKAKPKDEVKKPTVND